MRFELPLVQAGMGGGTAGHRLAAAVSEAGGLGTIGILPPERLREELAAARRLTAKPLAVNLLLPFARPAHWQVAAEADVVVTFGGRPRRRVPGVWLHQCGSVQEALAAVAAGADGVIAQGVEAGGHVLGTLPARELLARLRGSLPREFPILLAGDVADRADVARALEAGASAAVCGTRFVLSDESGAHPGYKARLLPARETILTELFGVGWPAPHRVVENAATRRWLRHDARGPAPVRALNRAGAPLTSRLPMRLSGRIAALQRSAVPLFSPSSPVVGSPQRLLDAAPLYAGESVARIDDVRPAATLVRDLTP